MKRLIGYVAFVVIALILSAYSLVYFASYNSTDCKQFVIDSYELHSGMNIPEVEFANCYYDELTKTRISVYDLKDLVNLDRFELSSSTAVLEELSVADLLAQAELPQEQNLYVASGEKWGKKWTYVVDTNAQRLWAILSQ